MSRVNPWKRKLSRFLGICPTWEWYPGTQSILLPVNGIHDPLSLLTVNYIQVLCLSYLYMVSMSLFQVPRYVSYL